MQLRALNGALRAFDSLEVVPIYQASIVCVGVAWGWTFYEENAGLSLLDTIMFCVGCGVSCAGVALLSFKAHAVPYVEMSGDDSDGVKGLAGAADADDSASLDPPAATASSEVRASSDGGDGVSAWLVSRNTVPQLVPTRASESTTSTPLLSSR